MGQLMNDELGLTRLFWRIMIDVAHISKTFRLYHSPADRLREILYRRKFHRVYDALKDVSFSVRSGETLGIIGQNGAGKSTLLKLMMGILLPDAGHVALSGRITGLLELTYRVQPGIYRIAEYLS